jgi:hypothetical protein
MLMNENAQQPVTAHDRRVLRDLARRQVDIANSEANRERRNAWLALDAGAGDRPMILCEWAPAYAKDFDLPWLQCEGAWARGLERQFRRLIHEHEVIRDDHVVEPFLDIGWDVRYTDYGVRKTDHHADNAGKLGARSWDPPLKDLRTDLAKLKQRVFSVDRQATLRRRADYDDIFGGAIATRIRGRFWWTLGMTWPAIDLIGLENLMLFMYDDPEGLHGLMRFLRDDHLSFISWAEAEGLLTLNNGNDYTGSGSMGYTRRLPQSDWKTGSPVRLKDLWVLLESQETVGVGPELFAEFIYPYQRDIAARFGSVYYGCCEPVHTRWHVLKELPNLQRVSVSPWCDQRFMGEELGRDMVFSRKPNPTLISTATLDEGAILADLRETLAAARGCRLEIIMKDVHELAGEPRRAARWVELARQAAAEAAGV